jgi:hypothetical protein
LTWLEEVLCGDVISAGLKVELAQTQTDEEEQRVKGAARQYQDLGGESTKEEGIGIGRPDKKKRKT